MIRRVSRKKDLKYIYGPVPSWRLGASLGIDPISQRDKICTFDCTYCQLGRTVRYETERRLFVPVEKIVDEINCLPSIKIDYITLSGRGEPTLALNLGEIIQALKSVRKERIAVLTNASLLDRKDVREDLRLADLVAVKLDASRREVFEIVNRPMKEITLRRTLEGIKEFRSEYRGRLALQMMFVEANKNDAEDLSQLAREIEPDEVQINTPLRHGGAKPLPQEEMSCIKQYFKRFKCIDVYGTRRKRVVPVSKEETLKRRGK
jgi:wyosine [tRNA(Phe)-imidazoG37] synthetase (radical SAM superfamily)